MSSQLFRQLDASFQDAQAFFNQHPLDSSQPMPTNTDTDGHRYDAEQSWQELRDMYTVAQHEIFNLIAKDKLCTFLTECRHDGTRLRSVSHELAPHTPTIARVEHAEVMSNALGMQVLVNNVRATFASCFHALLVLFRRLRRKGPELSTFSSQLSESTIRKASYQKLGRPSFISGEVLREFSPAQRPANSSLSWLSRPPPPLERDDDDSFSDGLHDGSKSELLGQHRRPIQFVGVAEFQPPTRAVHRRSQDLVSYDHAQLDIVLQPIPTGTLSLGTHNGAAEV